MRAIRSRLSRERTMGPSKKEFNQAQAAPEPDFTPASCIPCHTSAILHVIHQHLMQRHTLSILIHFHAHTRPRATILVASSMDPSQQGGSGAKLPFSGLTRCGFGGSNALPVPMRRWTISQAPIPLPALPAVVTSYLRASYSVSLTVSLVICSSF